MLPIPYFDAQAVRDLLDYDGCIDAVRTAMRDLARDGAEQPLRSVQHFGGGMFASMPGSLPGGGGFGAKLVSAFGDPARPGRLTHDGLVILFDGDTGALAGCADAGEVTAIRTAATSAVATDALAREEAGRLGIFGCGVQAATHIRAIARIRPIAHVGIWGRSPDRSRAFAKKMASETGLDIAAIDDPERLAADADILCTVTSSPTPVLSGEWVRPGTHVNLVGSSHAGRVEIDTALLCRSRYVVDSRAAALADAAELLLAKAAGLVRDDHIVAEIGEVLLGRVPGRRTADEITLYKSLGHIVQDLAALRYLLDRTSRSSRKMPSTDAPNSGSSDPSTTRAAT